MTKSWPPSLDPMSLAFAQQQDRFVRRQALFLLAICLFSLSMGLLVCASEDGQQIEAVRTGSDRQR